MYRVIAEIGSTSMCPGAVDLLGDDLAHPTAEGNDEIQPSPWESVQTSAPSAEEIRARVLQP